MLPFISMVILNFRWSLSGGRRLARWPIHLKQWNAGHSHLQTDRPYMSWHCTVKLGSMVLVTASIWHRDSNIVHVNQQNYAHYKCIWRDDLQGVYIYIYIYLSVWVSSSLYFAVNILEALALIYIHLPQILLNTLPTWWQAGFGPKHLNLVPICIITLWHIPWNWKGCNRQPRAIYAHFVHATEHMYTLPSTNH